MRMTSSPFTRDLVLIGGGHTHALILRMWGMTPVPGVRLTLISPEPTAAYSGMLPGFLAGHYQQAELDIDLVKLARFAGARLVQASAISLDSAHKQILLDGNAPPITYDVASIDIGIHARMSDIRGFDTWGTPVKPLTPFCRSWSAFRTGTAPARIAVIGAGVAGAEIAMAFAHAMQHDKRNAQIHLIDSGTALTATNSTSQKRIRRQLARLNIDLVEHAQIKEITQDAVVLSDRRIPADFICGAAGARPHDLSSRTDLLTHEGYFTVSPELLTSSDSVFAVGDCAHMAYAPRPKAGVYAVRQAPVLFHNLQIKLTGNGALKRYSPQADYLKLVSLGEKSALAERLGRAWSGHLMWRWKDRIDQRFMRQFHNLPDMHVPALPKRRAEGLDHRVDASVLCGGCGSKLPRSSLETALGQAKGAPRSDIRPMPWDDAALITQGDIKTVMTTDHLRAFVEDPVTMTRITAHHALGDIWAMGALPQAATITVILPRQSDTLAARYLTEIMQTAHDVFKSAGAAIVGGHSSQGAEMTIGFTLTGICDNDPITVTGAKPSDSLILTKPIGSGTILAAEMQRRARGAWVSHAYKMMSQSQMAASQILGDAHAMTDVTGFGLMGHLHNICQGSHVGARLQVSAIPTLPGAKALSQSGVRSTIYGSNRQIRPDIPESPETALLFDPQTAGGLLAAVPGDAQAVLDQLRNAGYDAACIGEITPRAGHIALD